MFAIDLTRLGEPVREDGVVAADCILTAVIDGHFVPNIMIMRLVVAIALRPVTSLPLEESARIEEPNHYLDAFAEADSDSMLMHVENATNCTVSRGTQGTGKDRRRRAQSGDFARHRRRVLKPTSILSWG
jgi:pentose-5-phosphate-3-epimerase